MNKTRINILFIMVQMAMGGSERLVHSLVKNIDRKLFNPSVAWFHGEKVLKEFEDLQIPLYHVPKRRKLDLATMRSFADIVKNANIHVVNAHHFISLAYSYYGCKIVNNVKMVYTPHSVWEIDAVSWKWKVMGRLMLRNVDYTVGVSAAVSDAARSKFTIPSHRSTIIQNGVDLKEFSKQVNKDVAKRRLGISAKDKIIGVVANLKKVKNHMLLLNAFYEVIKEVPNVKLLVIGQGAESDPENTEAELKRFVHEKKLSAHVIFLGYRSDVPELMRIMDVYCLTSLKEGLPINLIEAMASGLPAVGTNVEGIRDVITHNKTGLLVDVSDAPGLKRAILKILSDEHFSEGLSIKARNKVIERYSLEQCIKRYSALFLDVCQPTQGDFHP